jgi:hypothetical protein
MTVLRLDENLLFAGLVENVLCISHCTAWKVGQLTDAVVRWVLAELIAASYDVQSQNLLGDTEENHRNLSEAGLYPRLLTHGFLSTKL